MRVHRCASDVVELKKKQKANGRMCCTSSGRSALITESGGRGRRNISISKQTPTEVNPCLSTLHGRMRKRLSPEHNSLHT